MCAYDTTDKKDVGRYGLHLELLEGF
jgi:hypothetical protein